MWIGSQCPVTYNGSLISWISRKKKIMAMSTAEDEYVALVAAEQLLQVVKIMYTNGQLMDAGTYTLKPDNQAVYVMLAKPNETNNDATLTSRTNCCKN